uniref:YEATS domain-containing protein 2 isoform X2 n=1 Tax=Myxine glutinosa TaxID=7769 RepID=UPI00358FF793
MSGLKRSVEERDPDYEDVTISIKSKKQKYLENSARDATVQRIEMIIQEQFSLEIKNKEHEAMIINERLAEARQMLDKLRACIVASYYASAGQNSDPSKRKPDPAALNHPAVRKYLKPPSCPSSRPASPTVEAGPERTKEKHAKISKGEEKDEDEMQPSSAEKLCLVNVTEPTGSGVVPAPLPPPGEPSRLHVKKTIVVGNVSKYLNLQYHEPGDAATHKWMVYVRGPRSAPSLAPFVRCVWFFLHPSYRPHDLVEISEPPFHLTRRGWGEFPVRVQLHFKDPRNKRLDIIHHLKLDRTYTGLQTLGAETVVEVELDCRSLSDDPQTANHPLPILNTSCPASPPSLPPPPPPRPPVLQPSGSLSSSNTGTPQPPGNPATPKATETPQPPGTPQPSRSDTPSYSSLSGSLESASFDFDKPDIKDEEVTGMHGSGLSPHFVSESPPPPQTPPLQYPVPSNPTGPQPPTAPRAFAPHFNSAFQPLTVSCKILPSGGAGISGVGSGGSALPTTGTATSGVRIIGRSTPQPPPESPSRSFTPLTVSCKIVSGSPVSTPRASPLPRTPSQSPIAGKMSPGLMSVGSSYVMGSSGSPKIKITEKVSKVSQPIAKEELAFAAMPPLGPIGRQTPPQILTVKQEPLELPISSQSVPISTSQQAFQQFVAIRGGHVINVSAPNTATTPATPIHVATTCATPVFTPTTITAPTAKLLSLPVAAPLPTVATRPTLTLAAGRPVLLAQPLVPAPVTSVPAKQSLVVGPAPAATVQKTVTVQGHPNLQLPGSSLAGLSSLPPGTKLYLTTQGGRGGGGRGKQVLLIPQSAVLRGNVAGAGVASSVPLGGGSAMADTVQTPSHPVQASCTSYVLKQTPQGTFLVAQSAIGRSAPPSPTLPGLRVPAISQTSSILTQVLQSVAAPAPSTPITPLCSPSKNITQSFSSHGMSSGIVLGGAKPITIATSSIKPVATMVTGNVRIQALVKSRAQTKVTPPATPLLLPINPAPKTPPAYSISTSSSILHAEVKSEPGVKCTPRVSSPGPPCLPSPSWIKSEPMSTSSAPPVEQMNIDPSLFETRDQLLAAIFRKNPLFGRAASEKSPLVAPTLEYFLSWPIGKRRAAEWQRVRRVRRLLIAMVAVQPHLEVLVDIPTTRILATWCRRHGFTPPDPHTTCGSKLHHGLEDLLLQVDSEPDKSSTLSTSSVLLEEALSQTMKHGAAFDVDEEEDEEVDVLGEVESCKVKEEVEEMKHKDQWAPQAAMLVALDPAEQFIQETANEVGVNLESTEVIPGVDDMITARMMLKAMELFVEGILREGLNIAHERALHTRPPQELCLVWVADALNRLPHCDFITNQYMGVQRDAFPP